jgi:hypothetical protein
MPRLLFIALVAIGSLVDPQKSVAQEPKRDGAVEIAWYTPAELLINELH